ncbi:branched-chain amino acid transporter permease [Anaeromassilibacillus senegalensis]|uniref:branched-chain amino acid transporter permease n=1 Tax=Anaeromassilibacillus senegalensis TaxID=1673717 RepID=UPI00068064DE|nr:AzlD domain-containing protein [Anaeromassilibacillus senegalensis]
MLSAQETFLVIVVIAVVTFLTRLLPFALFPGKSEKPAWVLYLGRVLPYAIVAMLVVYCLKGVSVQAWPFGLPELIAVAAVVALHVWKKNTLLSIGAGTVLYMVLIQFVF